MYAAVIFIFKLIKLLGDLYKKLCLGIPIKNDVRSDERGGYLVNLLIPIH